MAGIASAVSLILALVAATWGGRRVSPVVVLIALGLVNLALAAAWGGDLGRVNDAITFHPVLALALGLLLGRLLDRSGALATLAASCRGLGRTPLGEPGVLILVVLLPLILCLPCGHIIAAALAPVLPSLCPESGREASAGVLAAAFARTAYGACGPAPAGGIGQIGEGWLAEGWPAFSPGVLRAPQIVALVLSVPAAAWIARSAVSSSRMRIETPKVTARGALALTVFLVALACALLRPLGACPVEVPLAIAAFALWPLCSRDAQPTLTPAIMRAALSPLVGLVIAFYAVGCVAAAGGLDRVGHAVAAMSEGGRVAGLIALVVAPSLLPMPCGRIPGFVLVPIVYELGPAKSGALSWREVVVAMAVLATTLSTSCAHSPFCGGGMVVSLRARVRKMRRSLAGSLIVAVPAAGAAMLLPLTTLRWACVIAGLGGLVGIVLASLLGYRGLRAGVQGCLGGLMGGALAGATLWVR